MKDNTSDELGEINELVIPYLGSFERAEELEKQADIAWKLTKKIQALITQKINEAERKGYGIGTVDTLEHVKEWADKTEVTYNDMMESRLNSLQSTQNGSERK